MTTPDALRRAAECLDGMDPSYASDENFKALDLGAHAARRLGDVIAYADQFVQGDPGRSTPGGSVARVILAIAQGEAT